ncbi:hypothetical protein BIV24_19765 [Streptomyces colonosanans]|uniref:Uncharacterized protein n=1 Tax=Streptomyces colonosanans TaxID=1428652 RepID=A0A1S2P786_9ACTN|nr:hypothetical protein [Streptomyces colonosanans]OIJ89551.1 hypothetical protein BIV24_19765 [Streptomyces colonosanans]
MSKAMSRPVYLGAPLKWPQPAPGCRVCAGLAKQRAEAAGAGDLSKVSDCNVEIRRHKQAHQRRP